MPSHSKRLAALLWNYKRLESLASSLLSITVFLETNSLDADESCLVQSISSYCKKGEGKEEEREEVPVVSAGEKAPISSIELSLASYNFSVSELLPKTVNRPL